MDKENIEQIFIKDVEEDNDMQTKHAMDFLADLAHYVGVSISLKAGGQLTYFFMAGIYKYLKLAGSDVNEKNIMHLLASVIVRGLSDQPSLIG